ncbi:MAG: sulfurtransferase complex subunit TusB [Candidatus Thorarchaeota archaeon]
MKFLIWLSADCTNLDEIVGALKKKGNEIGVLLVQDGVFLADKGCEHNKMIVDLKVQLFVSKSHVEERGIDGRLISDVKLVDYSDMVDLMMEKYDRIISM